MPALPSPPGVPAISAEPADAFPSFVIEARVSSPVSLTPIEPARVVMPPEPPRVPAPQPEAPPLRMDLSTLPAAPTAPTSLVLSESVAPEPPRPAREKKKTRDESRPRAERPRPARPRDHQPPAPTPRMVDAPRSARSGGSRAAAAFVVIVACSIGAGWMYYLREQLEPKPRPAVRTAPRVPSADERTLDAIERGTVTVQAPSGATPSRDGRATGFLRADEPSDGLQVPDVGNRVPPVGEPAIDAVVRNLEQATRLAADSAQRTKIDPRAPVSPRP